MNPSRIFFSSFGVPEEVVQVEEISVPTPGPGEVLVAVEAAPINPADLNYVEGVYGVKPELPATAGLEGYGRVAAAGPDVESPAVGTPVIFLRARGTWATHLVCPAEAVLPVPDGLSPLQAAMLKVNPMTAWRMLHDFIAPKKGEWIAQNAANSGVGQCVIQLAKVLGLHTVNLVRRAEARASLEALGGDIVLLDEKGYDKELPGKPLLGLNAVGGDSATRLMAALAGSGQLVTYGAMSRQALKVPNSFLLFKGIALHGFWVTRWLRSAPREEIHAAYAVLAGHMRDGNLSMDVEKSYPLSQAAEAIRHAKQTRRAGKILFEMQGECTQ